MFDAVKFGVAVVTEEEFSSFNQSQLVYNYAWTYTHKPKTEAQEKKKSEDFMEKLSKDVTLEEFVP